MSEELLTLPAGDPQRGYIYPPKNQHIGAGIPPPDEVTWWTDGQALYDEDVTRVTEAEHAVAEQRAADALAVTLKVSSLIPSSCSIKGTELVLLHVYGSGFTESTQIWWHDHLEPSVFVSENELTTWVTPWVFANPDNILVGVQDAGIDGDQQLYFGLLP